MMESLPHEMRRMIMEHFSNAELGTISLVNKAFNYEARSLMSSRANLNADLGMPGCQNVLPFLSHLTQMNVIPFSGIKIRWCSQDHSKLCSRPQTRLHPPIIGIVDRVAWKRLSVTMHGGCNYLPKKCPALQLLQKILKDSSAVLEQLELNNHSKLLRFIQEISKDRTFPHLKILKLQGCDFHNGKQEVKKSFIKELIPRSPNLQEFHQDGPPDLSENLLEGSSSAVLVSHCQNFNPALHEFSQGFTGTVKLKDIKLYYKDPFSMERFKRSVPRILQSSFDTLHYLWINLVFLVPLMGYAGLCLKNLSFLAIHVDNARLELTESGISSLLNQFDFTRIFPKLNKVGVALAPFHDHIPVDHITEFIAAAAVLENPRPDRAIHIKRLDIFGSFTAEIVTLLAGMFPNIDTLRASSVRYGERAPYPSIWKHWPDLKELLVENSSLYAEGNENLDSDFCGIFPAEVALLREKDDEYLKAVHIVPVIPSITCLKGLRKLKIVRRLGNPWPVLYDEVPPVFSKVTALVAFRACPNLSVTIQISWPVMFEALDHLRNYASVQLVE